MTPPPMQLPDEEGFAIPPVGGAQGTSIPETPTQVLAASLGGKALG